MKKTITNILKIGIPIAISVYLVWFLNQSLSEDEKTYIFDSFKNANYSWLIVSMAIGLFSHYLRAYRWIYMLEPLGKKPSVWNCYHSVMIGYVINLTFPRAGEAGRAGYLSKYEDLPFEKTFGTILAERVVDLVLIAIIGGTTVLLQLENVEKFQIILEKVNPPESKTNYMSYVVYAAIISIVLAGVFAFFKSEKLRNKLIGIVKGMGEGLQSILKIEKKWNYLALTVLIWVCYVLMFGICFYSMEPTSDIPLSIIMLGFLAGSIGIAVVQGGIGVYPILVAICITLHLGVPENSEFPFNQDGYALGWLIWIVQTFVVAFFGTISMMLMPRMNKK